MLGYNSHSILESRGQINPANRVGKGFVVFPSQVESRRRRRRGRPEDSIILGVVRRFGKDGVISHAAIEAVQKSYFRPWVSAQIQDAPGYERVARPPLLATWVCLLAFLQPLLDQTSPSIGARLIRYDSAGPEPRQWNRARPRSCYVCGLQGYLSAQAVLFKQNHNKDRRMR